MSIYLSIYLSLSLYIYIYICISISLSLSLYIYIYHREIYVYIPRSALRAEPANPEARQRSKGLQAIYLAPSFRSEYLIIICCL